MAIDGMHFGWIPKRSAWDDYQTWRASRQAAVQQMQDESSALMSSMTTALSNHIAGQASLITKIVSKRVAAEVSAKVATAQNSLNKKV